MSDKTKTGEKLSDEMKALIRTEAIAIMKMTGRAEAKGQATAAKKELADQFNAIMAKERVELNRKIAILADNLNKMMVMVSVLQDLVIESDTMAFDANTWGDLTKAQRHAEFGKMCDMKKIQMEAVGGKA